MRRIGDNRGVADVLSSIWMYDGWVYDGWWVGVSEAEDDGLGGSGLLVANQ